MLLLFNKSDSLECAEVVVVKSFSISQEKAGDPERTRLVNLA